MNRMTLSLTLLALLPLQVFAQRGCPEGYYEQNSSGLNSCIPIPGGEQSPPPGPKWVKTWGAIAVQAGGGAIGVSKNLLTKSRAKKDALELCREGGVTGCEVVLAYHHQCAAIAEIDRSVKGELSKRGYARGPDIDGTGRDAIASCESVNPGKSCEVIYSACTKPVLQQ